MAAVSFWGRIRSVFARAPALPAALGSVRDAFMAVVGGMTLTKRGDTELVKSFASDPWLHVVVGRRGEALSLVEWQIYRPKKGRGRARALMRHARSALERANRPTKKWSMGQRALIDELLAQDAIEEVFDHPILDVLDQPGGDVSGPELWELVSNWLDLLGEAVLVKERSGRRVIGLLPICPTRMTEIATAKSPFYGFSTTSGTMRRVPKADVIWIRRRDLLDPLTGRGIGTARALTDEIEIDEAMAGMAKARFFNNATPDMILGLLGPPPPGVEALKRFKQEMEDRHRGVERAGQTQVLGGDFKAQQFGHTMVESQYVQTRQFNRDMHMQGFGSPPEIFGVLQNANKSTITASREHFWVYSTMPSLNRIRGALQLALLDEMGDDEILAYRSMHPDDAEFEKSVMVALPGAFTRNEIRARAGEPPRPDGDEYYAQPGAGPSVPVAGDAPKPAAGKKADAAPEDTTPDGGTDVPAP